MIKKAQNAALFSSESPNIPYYIDSSSEDSLYRESTHFDSESTLGSFVVLPAAPKKSQHEVNLEKLKQDHLQKFTDYTLYKAKHDGITIGGFYKDQNQDRWLIKEGHYGEKSVVKEYVAGGLFQFFLKENAPQTEMIVYEKQSTLLTGSKLLNNFKTLNDYCSENNSPYADNFPFSFNGKKVNGFWDGISAIKFLQDTDAHGGNVGLIDHGDHYSFAKIDHGFSFSFDNTPITLDDFRMHLKGFYQTSLEEFSFDDVYQSINKIGEINFSKIEQLVAEKFSYSKTYLEAVNARSFGIDDYSTKNTLEQDLQKYQTDLLLNLKSNHEQYQKIANFMSLEKAIIEHDTEKFIDLTLNGTPLDEPFKPFFNPVYENRYQWDCHTKSVTAGDLLVDNWPNVVESVLDYLKSNNQPLSLDDVVGYQKDSISFDPAPTHNTPDPVVAPSQPTAIPMPQLELHPAVAHADFA